MDHFGVHVHPEEVENMPQGAADHHDAAANPVRPSPQAINAVEKFDGYGDAYAWLTLFNKFAELYGWDGDNRLLVAQLRMRSAAQRWVQRKTFVNWSDFETKFLDRFGETADTAASRLGKCRQKDGESPKEYADRFLQDAERAGRTEDTPLVLQFTEGLQSDLRLEVKRKQLQSIDAVVCFCNYWIGANSADGSIVRHPARNKAPQATHNDEPYPFTDYNSGPRGNPRPPFPNENRRPEPRVRFSDRPTGPKTGPGPYRPPPFRESTNSRNYQSPPLATPPKPAVADASNASVDDLAKRFAKLELNMAQQLQEREKEVRHLRHALQQQQRQHEAVTQINTLEEVTTTPRTDTPMEINFFEIHDLYAEDTSDDAASLEEVASFCHLEQQEEDEETDTYFFYYNEPETTEPPLTEYQVFQPAAGEQSADGCEYDYEFMAELLAAQGIDMATLFAKHARDEADPFSQRMPHKRVAIDPNANCPYVPNRPPHIPQPAVVPNAATGPTRQRMAPQPSAIPPPTPGPKAPTPISDASTKMPRNRQPFAARPYGATTRPNPAAAPVPGPAGTRSTPPPPATTSAERSEAARIADKKGREMAEAICRSMKLEGCQESNLVPKAAHFCCAGYLTGNPAQVEQGKNIARQVEGVIRRLSTHRSDTPPQVLNYAQPPPVTAPGLGMLLNRQPAAPATAGTRVSTCKVAAKVNGVELEAVVDTGASGTAVTNDCLRRLGLQHSIKEELRGQYMNADGHVSQSRGKVHLYITIGSMTTRVSCTVTEALSYDLLIGNDILSRVSAIIDYNQQKMTIQPNIGTYEVLDIHLNPSGKIPASLHMEEIYTTDEIEEDSWPSEGSSNPELTAVWWEYLDVLYSLPPEPPCVPGWKRCVSDTANEADSVEYEKWIDQRRDKLDQLQSQLDTYFPDQPQGMQDLLMQLHEEAADNIKSGATTISVTDWEEICTMLELDDSTQNMDTPDLTEALEDANQPEPLCPTSNALAATIPVMATMHDDTQYLQEDVAVEAAGAVAENTPTSSASIAQPGYWQKLTALQPPPEWLAIVPSWLKTIEPASDEAASYFEQLVSRLSAELDPTFDPWLACQSVLLGHPGWLVWAQDMLAANPDDCTDCDIPDLEEESSDDSNDEDESTPPSWLSPDKQLLWQITQEVLSEEGLPLMTWQDAPRWFQDPKTLPTDSLGTSHVALPYIPQPYYTCSSQARATNCHHIQAQEAVEEVLMVLESPYEGMDPDIRRYLTCVDLQSMEDTQLPYFSREEPAVFLMEDEDDLAPPSPPADCYGPVPVYVNTGVTTQDYVPVGNEGTPQQNFEHANTQTGDGFPVRLPVIDKPYTWAAQDPTVIYAPEEDSCAFPDEVAILDPNEAIAAMLEGSNLSPEQHQEALQFLHDNADVFCFRPEDLGTCTVGCHVIDTGDAEPIRQGYYRLPWKKLEILKAEIDRLVKIGVLRKSNSPWASPCHLVPKKEPGTWRPVFDFRRLNAVTRKDAYPMPRVNDILYNIREARWLSSIDLFQGYNQVLIHPDSIPCTAVATPWGLYESVRMSFGLCNGPAQFQRILNEILSEPYDLLGHGCYVYIDDIVAHASTFQGHMEVLRRIFECLRRANLKMNPKKSHFFQEEITFLGFVVNQFGLKPDPRLISAVENRRPPRNSLEVASFVGLCSYYRRFVEGFSKIAEPLTRIMGKNRQFEWGPEQQQAFDILKDRLIRHPILRRADLSKPFIVYTDASRQGVGAILAQRDEESGREFVVAYHSKALTPIQKRSWTISELECYAVINAVCDQWPDLLLGHPFKVVTDHSALVWLMTAKNLQGKLARWALRLSEFMGPDCSIEHRPGAAHKSVDALTRWGVTDTDPEDGVEPTTSPGDVPEPLLYCDHPHNSIWEPYPTDEFYTLEETLDPTPPRPSSPVEPHSPVTQEPGTVLRLADLQTPVIEEDWVPGVHSPATIGVPVVPAKPSRKAQPIRIAIEGNIGSGKSTVINYLDDHLWNSEPSWTVKPEPVSWWEHLLPSFYEAPAGSAARHSVAALLQIAVLNAYAFTTPGFYDTHVILERGPFSSIEVFLPAQDLPPVYEDVVYHTADLMQDVLEPALPTAVIYLDATPEACLTRVASRQRPGEGPVSLEYLQKLDKRYKEALEQFGGPKRIIDANQDAATVAAAVLEAVNELSIRHSSTKPYHHTLRLYNADHFAYPGCNNKNDNCCPEPAQLLTLEDSPSQGTQETHTTNEVTSTTEADDSLTTSESADYDYIPTPLTLIYDPDLEVPILFQSGPGEFDYSDDFKEKYMRQYGTPVDPQHRIDNARAVQVFSTIAPWNSNAEGANIQLAVAPRKAIRALKIVQMHESGGETVYVDAELHAKQRYQALAAAYPSLVQRDYTAVPFPWLDGLHNEAYVLDSWIRIVRVRPLLRCGLQAPTPGFISSCVQPVELEYSQPEPVLPPLSGLRLASSMPHTEGPTAHVMCAERDQVVTTELNMMDKQSAKRPRRQTTATAPPDQTTPSHTDEDDSGPSVDPDLPCMVCGDPGDAPHMLLCSNCQTGCHTYCAKPSLRKIPSGDWYCHICRTKNKPASPHTSDYSPSADTTEEPSSELQAAQQQGTPILPRLKRRPTAASAAAAAAAAAATSADQGNTGLENDDSGSDDDADDIIGGNRDIHDDEGVLYYLKNEGQFNPELLPATNRASMKLEMKRIARRASSYRWDDRTSQLYRRPTQRYPQERLVPPPSEREGIVDETHCDLGHMGVARVCSLIMQRMYWPGIYKQVQQKVKQCEDCLRNRVVFGRHVPELHCIAPPSLIWERVSLDSMGPFPPSKHGMKHIIVGVDNLSKYVECEAVPELNCAAVCRFFADRIISNHGVPSAVLCDNGPEYSGTQFKSMLQTMNIRDLRSAAYHPQGNGAAEAVVKTLTHSLQRAVQQDPTTWCEKLPMIVLGMRTAKHSTHRHSPYYLCTGRHPRLPFEARYAVVQQDNSATAGPDLGPTNLDTWSPSRPQTRHISGQAPTQQQNILSGRAWQLGAEPHSGNTAAEQARPQMTDNHEDQEEDFDAAIWEQAIPAALQATQPTQPLARQVFGPQGSPPINLIDSSSDDGLDAGTKHLLRQRQEQRPEVAIKVENNILASQERQKRDFKRRHLQSGYQTPPEAMPVGSLVLMSAPASMRSKLHQGVSTEGPYEVVAYSTPGYAKVVLRDAANRKWSVSTKRICPYSVDQPKK